MKNQLTTAEFAAALGVQPRQVRRLIDSGTIPDSAVERPTPQLYLIDSSALTAARKRDTKRGPKPKAAKP